MARLIYAEQHGTEPHRANPPLRWWYRWASWRQAQAQRAAREAVDARGLANVNAEQRKLYDALVLAK